MSNIFLTNDQKKGYQEYLSKEIIEKDGAMYVGDELMVFASQQSIMYEYARTITEDGAKSVLEIGYGAGVFAEEVQKFEIKKHVIVECHNAIANHAIEKMNSRKKQLMCVTVINDLWQNTVQKLGKFDAIFYDSYSPTGHAVEDLLCFIDVAFSTLLNENGVFSFWYCASQIHSEILHDLKNKSKTLTISMHESYNQDLSSKNKKYIIFKAKN